MKLGCLISGGKDSLYSAYLAREDGHDISCFLSVISKNKDSFMFHTPNIEHTKLQAEAANIPILTKETLGEKEVELEDLRSLISEAKEKYGIEGVVTGAVQSVYQSSRIQRTCLDLGLWCFNPLWQLTEDRLLKGLKENNFDVIIASVAAEPLDEKWLGRKLDDKAVKELFELKEKYGISPIGEGGEFESFVVNCPLFEKKINITRTSKEYKNNYGRYIIEEAEVI